jgi:hypothetical protein
VTGEERGAVVKSGSMDAQVAEIKVKGKTLKGQP